MKQEYMEAFTEVDEIIKLMPKELVAKIPNKFREMIQEEKSIEYVSNIKEPIEQCKLKNETIVILGLIYRDFLCSPEEKRRLQEKDAKEIQEMQQELEQEMREKYNPDDIFKKKKEAKQEYIEQIEQKSIAVIQEEKWYQKIFNIIKGLFKRY